MRKAIIAVFILLLALCFGSAAERAAAMTLSSPAAVGWTGNRFLPARYRALTWAPRQFWQWDHRPVRDDPWAVLRPNFWGSAEPHLVPADIWACKWHLPTDQSWSRSWARDWRWRRRLCPAWQ
jgi:hypothetical protein